MKKDLITTRMKLKDVFPDLTEKYSTELELKTDDVEFIRKGITPANLEIKEGERAVISYITTAAKDRDGEIVLPSGAILTEYRKNPVVLFGHNYRDLPIGKNMWIKSDDKGLIAKTKYANHDEADKVYEYRKDGFPLAESIGFVPVKSFHKRWINGKYDWMPETLESLAKHDLTAKDLKNVWSVYTKWILLEYSDVAVPANPEATQIAIGKGLIPEIKGIENEDFVLHGNGVPIRETGIIEIQEQEIIIECTKDIEGVECECPACKSEQEDYEDESENNTTELMELVSESENTSLIEFVKGMILLKEAGCTTEEATIALKELAGLTKQPETKPIEEDTTKDPDELDFELEEDSEEDSEEFDIEDPTMESIIKEVVKQGFDDSKKAMKDDLNQTVKDTIDILKGKVVK